MRNNKLDGAEYGNIKLSYNVNFKLKFEK